MLSLPSKLDKLLSRCPVRERLRLTERFLKASNAGRDDLALRADLERALARSERRFRGLPRPTFPPDLPVVQRKSDIAGAIADPRSQVVVLCGDTGSGKTTQLPKICLEVGRGVTGLIGHTQPRRIAARNVAARIAQELGSSLGADVGFKIRFADQTGPNAYIKVMTDGILLAETQRDPLLAQYDTLIIDEAHERSLNIDFLLGYIKRLLDSGERDDLKVIITSATIDPERFKQFFESKGEVGRDQGIEESGDQGVRQEPARSAVEPLERFVPIVNVSGRTYPVEVRYRPVQGEFEEMGDADPLAGVGQVDPIHAGILRAVDELGREPGPPGDILVFLPGERDIRDAAEALRKRALPSTEILPLYGRLSSDEQQRIFQQHARRRVVLATNVAETSLTVPGIKYVIDTGLARISRYSPRIKVQRLPIEAISRASADQRKGRCGRESPGVCIRLYSGEDFDQRPEFTEPEILRTNLASVILQMKALGLGQAPNEIETFPFIQRPDDRSIRDGYETLHEIGAIDEAGHVTRMGRDLARLPIDPRIARMITAAEFEDCVPEVLVIAAALSIQDPRERPMEKADSADAAHGKFRDQRSDFLSYIRLWITAHEQLRALSSGKFRKWCRDNFINYLRFREWQDIHHQLHALIAERTADAAAASSGEAKFVGPRPRRPVTAPHPLDGRSLSPTRYDPIHRALLSGLLSSIGKRSEQPPHFEYDGPRSTKFYVFPGSSLFKGGRKQAEDGGPAIAEDGTRGDADRKHNKDTRWIMAAELVRTTRLYGRTCAAIEPGWIERLAEHLVRRTHSEPLWDSDTSQVVAFERVTLFGLELVKRRRVHYGPINPEQCRALFIHHALVNGEYLTPGRFFEHNLNLTREITDLQTKARRHDVLVDAQARFIFYDKKVPLDVYSGPTFEKWRRHAEARDPRILFMSREDLIRPGIVEPSPDDFPRELFDRTPLGEPLRLTLEYKFDPAEKSDGITVTVPVGAVRTFDPRPMEWLVPGLLPEKIAELIRTLPKHLRISFVPVPKFAEPCAVALQTMWNAAAKQRSVQKGQSARPLPDLLDALAEQLRLLGDVHVPHDAWKPESLPDHLRPNFRIVDVDGNTLAEGRDWSVLRAELDSRLEDALSNLPPSTYNRANITHWDFGDLPEETRITLAGGTLKVHPALRDESDLASPEGLPAKGADRMGMRVSLRLFDNAGKARLAMTRGLRRLLMFQVRGQIESLIDTTPGIERVGLNFRSLGSREDLRRGLVEIISDRAFGHDEPGAQPAHTVRNREDFDLRLEFGWNRLGRSADEAFRVVADLAAAHQRVAALLSKPLPKHAAAAEKDIREQLALLVPAGFLMTTPWKWLRRLPVYCSAIEKRLESIRSLDGAPRDAALMSDMLRFWRVYTVNRENVRAASFEEFRWMVEEFRVSLFAQSLGTVVPVSAKRLERAWEAVEREVAGAAAVPAGKA